MTAPAVTADSFEQLYAKERDPIYKALVLATDDRDLSLEASDGAFVALRRRLRRGDPAGPDVLRRALGRVAKAGGSDIRGFRLPDGAVSSEATTALAAVRALDMTDRMIVIADAYLGWDGDAVAAAVGLDPAAAALRRRDAADTLGRRLGIDPADAGDVLRAHLAEIAAGISLPLSRLESVRSESTAQRALLAGAGVVAAAAVAVAALVGWNALRSDPPPAEVAAPGAARSDPGQPAAIAAGSVEWEESGTPLPDSELQQVTAGPDGFLAIGQAFEPDGGATMTMALRSTDGFDWDTAQLPSSRRGGWIATLAYEEGRYVAAGTSYDERNGSEAPELYVSDDGETWENITVPTESVVTVDEIELTVSTSLQGVTARGSDIVVLASQYAQTDIVPLIDDRLPDGVSANGGWGMTQDGMEFYDNQGNVSHRATFAELGVSPELASFFTGGRPRLLLTSDGGETWDEIPSAEIAAAQGFLAQMVLTDNGLVALMHPGAGGGQLWALRGETWERADLERGLMPTSLARLGDTLYMTAAVETGERTALFRSTDAVAWTRVDDPALADVYVDRLVASPHGIVALGQPGDTRHVSGPAIVEKDGLVVEISETGLHHVKTDAGESVVKAYHEDIERTSTSVTILDPETGAEVVTLDTDDIDRAWEAVWNSPEVAPAPQQVAVVVTRDGATWTALDTTDAFPSGFYPHAAAVGASAVLLTGWVEGGGGSGPTILVGTFTP